MLNTGRPQIDVREFVANLPPVPWWKRWYRIAIRWLNEEPAWLPKKTLDEYAEDFHRIYVNGLREQLGLSLDWDYREIYCDINVFSALVKRIGTENFVCVAGSSQIIGDWREDHVCFFVSAEGIRVATEMRAAQ
jgi:hypothetical protein